MILNARAEHPPPDCPLIDQHLLAWTGAIALRRRGAQIEATFSARDRIWSSGSEETSSHGVEGMDRLDRMFRQGVSP
ncbi:hypothetical protein [Gemmobacter sp. 24YEA27]|uniref:hypothetical protein n=1 Tax=Gemmobacter sp. 24YEA27 TaxID=3040672 RepID=UPI0024B3B798|nr:hypothetical protein [Gemmobacter sp. 24YEA27]